MNALIIVDVQNDFCPGGALAIDRGDEVVPIINELMDYFDVVVASQDWHPKDSVHFQQWPVHCVRETQGAQLHPRLNKRKIQAVLFKGTANRDDGYSAFEATNLDLKAYLKERDVHNVYVAGLATDYCVKATALDAVKAGFKTYLVKDACRCVDNQSGDCKNAIFEMAQKGVILVTTKQDIPATNP